MDLHAPGELLNDRYRILSLVGKGGNGAVYKARDMRFKERVVAVKQMLDDEADPDHDPEWVRKQINQEADVLERLSHASIPKVLDHFSDESANYVVMEFIEGTSLERMLKNYQEKGQIMPQEQVLEFALKICDILIYLHEQPEPVIHRDVKPQNVIVREGTSDVVLVDFGLARNNPNSSGTNTLVGTLGYAPLEQFKGRPEPRSDLYALGASMHHLLSGSQPNPFQIPPLAEVFPEVHPAVANVVDRACQEKPDRRYSNAQTMKAAIKRALGELTGIQEDLVPGMQAPVRSAEDHQPMSGGAFVLTALLIFATGVGALYGLSRFLHPPAPVASASPSASPSSIASTRPPMDPQPLPPPASPDGQGSSGSDSGPFQPRRQGGRVSLSPPTAEQARTAKTLLSPICEGNWKCVGIIGVDSLGMLQASPGKAAAVVFKRTVAEPPRQLSFTALRQEPGDFQVQLGNMAVLSQVDRGRPRFGVQLVSMGGGTSPVIFQDSSQLQGTYQMDWDSDTNFTLDADGQQVHFGGVPLEKPDALTIILSEPPEGTVHLTIQNLNTD